MRRDRCKQLVSEEYNRLTRSDWKVAVVREEIKSISGD
jgi:hypothetical protein